MNLLIAGDLVPTESNRQLFANGDIDDLLGEELIDLWQNTEKKIFNLEAPLVDIGEPIKKCGPNLKASLNTIKSIKKLNPSLVSLANNHILDYGEHGVNSTINILNDNKLKNIGAGKNLIEASKPHIFNYKNIKIGIYTCAENEFTIATEKSAGANPFDPFESFDHIVNLKSKCDYVIVLYHGGKEHYRYPSPYLQKVCRKIAEKGADVIICQHSHCIGCFEEYNNSTIVYGQGNFIFDGSNSEYWNESLLVNISIKNKIQVKYIPIVKFDNKIRLANKNQSEKILNDFNERSKEILKEDFIQDKYKEIAKESLSNYLRMISKENKWISRIDRHIFKSKILNYKFRTNNLLSIRNYIECEAHSELILEGIKEAIKNESR